MAQTPLFGSLNSAHANHFGTSASAGSLAATGFGLRLVFAFSLFCGIDLAKR